MAANGDGFDRDRRVAPVESIATSATSARLRLDRHHARASRRNEPTRSPTWAPMSNTRSPGRTNAPCSRSMAARRRRIAIVDAQRPQHAARAAQARQASGLDCAAGTNVAQNLRAASVSSGRRPMPRPASRLAGAGRGGNDRHRHRQCEAAGNQQRNRNGGRVRPRQHDDRGPADQRVRPEVRGRVANETACSCADLGAPADGAAECETGQRNRMAAPLDRNQQDEEQRFDRGAGQKACAAAKRAPRVVVAPARPGCSRSWRRTTSPEQRQQQRPSVARIDRCGIEHDREGAEQQKADPGR